MFSAHSPKYVALYDPDSGVHFSLGWATVTEEQALQLAERMFVDGIEIGDFDADGRPINLVPAKKWRKARRGDADDSEHDGNAGDGTQGESGADETNTTEATAAVAEPKPRRK